VERAVPLREIVTEALREWLDRYEEIEDLRAIDEAIQEAAGDPGISWDEMKAELHAAERGAGAAERA
jgi:hypothetical protein